jgi:hypothetical protein
MNNYERLKLKFHHLQSHKLFQKQQQTDSIFDNSDISSSPIAKQTSSSANTNTIKELFYFQQKKILIFTFVFFKHH